MPDPSSDCYSGTKSLLSLDRVGRARTDSESRDRAPPGEGGSEECDRSSARSPIPPARYHLLGTFRLTGGKESGRSRQNRTAVRRRLLLPISILFAVGAVVLPHSGWENHGDRPVVYGFRNGEQLTLDVIPAPRPTGAGVLVIQSGGWESRRSPPSEVRVALRELLDQGIAVIAVRHTDLPTSTIPEAAEDIRRAARFVRSRAEEYHLDGERLGVFGISSGGHLALLLGTRGDAGNPAALDPVDRYPSRVKAVAAVSPPTDLRGWAAAPPPRFQRTPVILRRLTLGPAPAAEVSPVIHVTPRAPATLLIHGDQDELVPIDHSRAIAAALGQAGVSHKFVEIRHGGHALAKEHVMGAVTNWFGQRLSSGQGL
ncbi:alpha/beta hydrolase [bacterium]|nr:alpha/beta hydrolase [bacterium]